MPTTATPSFSPTTAQPTTDSSSVPSIALPTYISSVLPTTSQPTTDQSATPTTTQTIPLPAVPTNQLPICSDGWTVNISSQLSLLR